MDQTKGIQLATTGAQATTKAALVVPPTATTLATVAHVEQPAKSATPDANGLLPAWLALVGVIITIIGKWVADWFQRRYEFRRQLYLDLVNGKQTVTNCLGRLCDKDIVLSETTQKYQGTGPVLAKVELAAPKKLSRELTEFKNVSGAAVMQLMAMRAPIEMRRIDLKFADEQIAIYQEQQRLLVEEMRRMSIEGIDDKARRERVDEYFDGYEKEIGKQQTRKQEDVRFMVTQTREMSVVAMRCLIRLARMTPRMLKYARRGLGYWFFDQMDYQKRTEESVAMMEKAMDELQKSVNMASNFGNEDDKNKKC